MKCREKLMVKRRWWCVFLSVLLIVGGAGSVRAVEYGEMVQKDGKWVFGAREDPTQTHAHEGADYEREIPRSVSTKGEKLD
jgi:hypothetical protein